MLKRCDLRDFHYALDGQLLLEQAIALKLSRSGQLVTFCTGPRPRFRAPPAALN